MTISRIGLLPAKLFKMTTTSFMESNGMVGRHEKEYGSEFDNYEEADDEYEEDELQGELQDEPLEAEISSGVGDRG